MLGGFTVAWTEGTGKAVTLPAHRDIVPVVCIPHSSLATKKARGLLPETVSHADASFNLSRSALLVAAMTRFPGLLMEATDDKLHQQQRREAMPRSLDLVAKLREAGFPAAVSGAGPTVIAFANKETAPLVAPLVGGRFDVLELSVDPDGASVVPLDA